MLVCHFGEESVGVCCDGGGDGDAERGLATLSGAWSVRGLEVMLLREMCVLLRRQSKVVVVVSWRGWVVKRDWAGGLIGGRVAVTMLKLAIPVLSDTVVMGSTERRRVVMKRRETGGGI